MHAAGGLIPSRQALRATYNQKLQCELIPRKHRWKLIPYQPLLRKHPQDPWKSNASTKSNRSLKIFARASSSFGGIFDVDRKERRLEEVNREIENPDLWNDPKHAQEVSKEKKMLDDIVGSFKRLTAGVNDAADLFELSMAEEDWPTVEAVGEDAEKIKGMIDEKLMVQDIVRRKAADILYDSAVKTEPKPEEEKPAEETSEEAPAEEPSAE